MLPNERNDLKVLKIEIEKIIKDKIQEKVFDIEEIEICQNSNYYKHIEFERIS